MPTKTIREDNPVPEDVMKGRLVLSSCKITDPLFQREEQWAPLT
jgi:hypothetical protein